LTVAAGDPQAFQERVRRAGIRVAPPQPSKTPGQFDLAITTNESLLRRSPEELARALSAAV
jgi:hypothetical protein